MPTLCLAPHLNSPRITLLPDRKPVLVFMVKDIAEAEEQLASAHTDLQQSQHSLEQKQERMEEIEARSRDLYDTTVRLEAHIADLESRKRAPLYQKKQEEELKAATEKAQECEIRAVDAEFKYKEAKVGSAPEYVACGL